MGLALIACLVCLQATLCSMKGCMAAMVAQLKSDSEDLQQVWGYQLALNGRDPLNII